MDNKFLNGTGVIYLWNKATDKFLSKADANALSKILVEGYYYAGHFYGNSDMTSVLSGIEGKLYIDMTTNAMYRYDSDNGYIKLTASGSSSGGSNFEGNSIASTILNEDFTLTINFTDGTSYTTASIRGEKGEKGDIGPQGEKGDAGDSGYSVAKENGFEGTAEEWLYSLKGEKGEKGEKGDTGVSPTFKVMETDTGYQLTITDAIGEHVVNILHGSDGSDGTEGAAGNGVKDIKFNSDYSMTITLENGETFTSSSLRGEKGANGADGAAGSNGVDGEHCYHYWDGTTLVVTSKSGSSSANLKGSDGVGIKTVNQTSSSSLDGGNNIITITLTDGTTQTVTIKNGSKGGSAYDIAVKNGYDGGDEKSWLESLRGKNITISNITQTNESGGSNVIEFSDGSTLVVKNGTKGEQGTGVTILGSYDSEESLAEAHPTGIAGDSYLINSELYVWSETETSWINVGTIRGPQGEKGETGAPGAAGADGVNGKDGSDGISPIVNITSITGGHRVEFADRSGTHSFDVMDGSDGADGQDGANGTDGKDITITSISESEEDNGENTVTFSTGETITIKNGSKGSQGEQGKQGAQGPQGEKGDKGDTGAQGPQGEKGDKGDKGDTGTAGANGQDGISCEHSWNGTTLTVVSASGSSSADLKGEDGIDGVSPTINVSKSGKVTTLTITDKNGTKTTTINDGADGEDGADGSDATVVVDAALDNTSTNAIQNKVVKAKFDELSNKIDNENIPDYWMTALDEGVQAINQAMTTAGYNKSAFLFYSDSHWNYGSQVTPKLLKYIYKHTAMTKTNFGGDIVNDEASDYDTMEYLWDWRNQLKGLPNHHSVVGNHDDGNSTNNLFSEQYVYGYLLAAEETSDIVRGDDGIYYYIDHSPEKTRYLYLDTAYKGVNDNQQAFIKNALLTTPAGWHIVVIAHAWYEIDYNQYSVRPVPIKGLNSNASIIISMLDNYNSRTGDYADCEGWVEFCIGGHIHYDYDATTETGIPIILVETDSHHTRGNYTSSTGTDTEASISGIIADYTNHTINIVRIGRGESREIEVTNYVVSYTNLLPTAVSRGDINTILTGNGTVGYVEKQRWSGSSGAYIAHDTVDTTGLIPCSEGDTVYLKNMTIFVQSGLDQANISLYKIDGTYITGVALTSTPSTQWSVLTDDEGNFVQFKIPNWNNGAKFFSISCQDINEASIVTVNEPID